MKFLILLVIYCNCALSTNPSDNIQYTVENAATLVKDTWEACSGEINGIEESESNKAIVLEIKNILNFIEVGTYVERFFKDLSVDRKIYEYENDETTERAAKRRQTEQNQHSSIPADGSNLEVARTRKQPQNIVNRISIINFSRIKGGCKSISRKFHQIVNRVKENNPLNDRKKVALMVECKKIRNKFIDMLTLMLQAEESSKTTDLVRAGINEWSTMRANQLAVGISALKYINKKANRPTNFVNAFADLANQIKKAVETVHGINSATFSAIKNGIFGFNDLGIVMKMFERKRKEMEFSASAKETENSKQIFRNPLKNTKQISNEIYTNFKNQFDATSNLIKELINKLEALDQAENIDSAAAEILKLSTEINEQFEKIITAAIGMEKSNDDMLSEIISTYGEYIMPTNTRATELVPFVNKLLEVCGYLDQIVSCINKLNSAIEINQDQRPGFITAFLELEVVPIYSDVVRLNFVIATNLDESPNNSNIPTSEAHTTQIKDALPLFAENTKAFVELVEEITTDFQQQKDTHGVGSSSSDEDEEHFDNMDRSGDEYAGDEDELDTKQVKNQIDSESSSSVEDEDENNDYKPEENHIDKIQKLMVLANTFQNLLRAFINGN